ncbi:MAG: ABC transporter permease [Verrucomicrobia bacterium]|nr:ABC transporter permease [Verrucomicrobiota bacterium]
MRVYITLLRRELAGFFFSMTGYVLMAATLLLLGVSFSLLLESLNADAVDVPITELFYRTQFFWLILLVVSPLITMRTFALEKHTGTYETLMTTPVSDAQVVLAKFSAVLVFYLVLWSPLLAYPWLLSRFTGDASLLNPGALGGTYLGIALFGAVFMAMGCFASALTRSQIVAAMIGLALGMALFLGSFLGSVHPPRADWQTQFYRHISMVDHLQDFCRGIVDTRAVAYYLGLTAFFLFLTLKSVESRRWK